MSLLITLQGRHSNEKRGPAPSLAVSTKTYKTDDISKRKTWQPPFIYWLSSCSVSRFGVSLPQSKAPFTATGEGLCSEEGFLDRGLEWTWSRGCRILCVSHWPWPAFKNEKVQKRDPKGWACSTVFEHLSSVHEARFNPRHHKERKEKEKRKEKEAFFETIEKILKSHCCPTQILFKGILRVTF